MLDHFTLVMEWKKLFHLKQCSGAKKFQIFGHSVLSPIVMFWRMKTYNFHASFTPKKIIGRLFKWNIEVKSKEGRHENWRSCQFIVTYRICNPKRGFQVFFAVKKMAFFSFSSFFLPRQDQPCFNTCLLKIQFLADFWVVPGNPISGARSIIITSMKCFQNLLDDEVGVVVCSENVIKIFHWEFSDLRKFTLKMVCQKCDFWWDFFFFFEYMA